MNKLKNRNLYKFYEWLEQIFCQKIEKKFAETKKCTTFALAIERSQNGVVVQLVRIHACHAWGRGFESRPYRH